MTTGQNTLNMSHFPSSRQMRIAIIGPSYPLRGGVAHYTTLLSRELSRNHTVRLISFKRQYPSFLFPGRSNYDPSQPAITDRHAAFMIDSMNPWTWEKTVRYIKDFRPDTVLFQWWVSFWAPHFYYMISRLRKARRPPEIVFICHNVFEHETSRIKKAITTRVLSLAERFVTHSRQDTHRLRQILPNDAHITTAFLPTLSDYCADAPPKDHAKMQLGISGDVLLFFGFIREYKGLHVLLKAMPHILSQKKLTLLVAGEFWESASDYLDEIARRHLGEHVRIIDSYIPDEEAGIYFAAADLVVQPYLHASGSAVTQLAYGFDRPVIATNVGSLPDVIEDRITGRLVPPNDARALAAAILDSLDPKTLETLSENCKLTKAKFSWKKMTDMILAFE